MASNYGGDRAYCGKANAGLGAPAGHQCRPSWHSTCWDLVVCWYRAHGNIVQKRQRGLFVVALGFAGVPKLADLNGDGGSGGMAQRAVGRSLMPHLFAALAVDRKGRRRGRRGGVLRERRRAFRLGRFGVRRRVRGGTWDWERGVGGHERRSVDKAREPGRCATASDQSVNV